MSRLFGMCSVFLWVTCTMGMVVHVYYANRCADNIKPGLPSRPSWGETANNYIRYPEALTERGLEYRRKGMFGFWVFIASLIAASILAAVDFYLYQWK